MATLLFVVGGGQGVTAGPQTSVAYFHPAYSNSSNTDRVLRISFVVSRAEVRNAYLIDVSIQM